MNSPQDFVKKSIKNKNLFKHMLATEAAMSFLAKHFDEDSEKWALAGLLHDVDYDLTVNDFPNHGKLSAKMLEDAGVDQDIIDAVSRHPGHKDNMPQTNMDWALHTVDSLTGLIVAAALMHPDKKLSALNTEFIVRRFGEKRFAAGANREQIALCQEKLDIKLEDFIDITLKAMISISDQLGL